MIWLLCIFHISNWNQRSGNWCLGSLGTVPFGLIVDTDIDCLFKIISLKIAISYLLDIVILPWVLCALINGLGLLWIFFQLLLCQTYFCTIMKERDFFKEITRPAKGLFIFQQFCVYRWSMHSFNNDQSDNNYIDYYPDALEIKKENEDSCKRDVLTSIINCMPYLDLQILLIIWFSSALCDCIYICVCVCTISCVYVCIFIFCVCSLYLNVYILQCIWVLRWYQH